MWWQLVAMLRHQPFIKHSARRFYIQNRSSRAPVRHFKLYNSMFWELPLGNVPVDDLCVGESEQAIRACSTSIKHNIGLQTSETA